MNASPNLLVSSTGTEFGISLGISRREPFQHIVEVAQHAEALGISHVWVVDSQLAMKDAYAALVLIARGTSSILLGPGVTNPLTRDLTVTANAIAAVQEVSGGRAVLGLGAGSSAVIPIGKRPATLDQCRAAVTELRALLEGQPVKRGRWTLPMLPAPTRTPIFLGASQPRMLSLAGELADGSIVMGLPDPDFLKQQIESVRAGAAAAGKDGSAISVDLWLTISVGDDSAAALDDVRSFAATQAVSMRHWRNLPSSLTPHRKEMEAIAHQYTYNFHLSVRAPHKTLVSDALASKLALAGDASFCRERLKEIINLNPDRITFAILPGDRRARLETLVGDVLAHI